MMTYLSTIPRKFIIMTMVMQISHKIQPHNKNLTKQTAKVNMKHMM